MKYLNSKKGFTIIELVTVIVILGVLAVTAVPKFLSFSKDAKTQVLNQIQMSVQTANTFMYIQSQLPSYAAKLVPGRADLIDVDTDKNGSYDTRLKWNYLDNTDIEKRIEISSDFIIQYKGITDTYIGYDSDNDNLVSDNNCYFRYTQSAGLNLKPSYRIENTDC